MSCLPAMQTRPKQCDHRYYMIMSMLVDLRGWPSHESGPRRTMINARECGALVDMRGVFLPICGYARKCWPRAMKMCRDTRTAIVRLTSAPPRHTQASTHQAHRHRCRAIPRCSRAAKTIAPARPRCDSRRLPRHSAAPAALDNPLRSRSCRRHWVNKKGPDL